MLIIDGSQGEGGGQILRTALSLAMITGTPFRLDNVRAGRRKPGLLRQHLTCVKAAAEISGAKVDGAVLGSRSVSFKPGAIRGGDYTFAVGSAGSSTLVFQTVLPALLRAAEPSRLKLSGGTHNPSAPTFDYLERVFLPQLARMGASVGVHLGQAGFYPAGGGRWSATIEPVAQLTPLVIDSAGALVRRRIIADVANVGFDVARRETHKAAELMSWPVDTCEPRTVKSAGPGNVVAIEIAHEHVTEIFTGFGERGIAAETVAASTVDDARAYLAAGAPVGPHLADQLLLPLALAGGGSFVTMPPTQHTRTNIAVIEKFLPVTFAVEQIEGKRWRIVVE